MDVKVLTVSNLAQLVEQLGSLYEASVLGDEEQRQLERRFHSLTGSWCCATKRDKTSGLPNNYGFRLPVLAPAEVQLGSRRGSAQAGPIED